MFKSPIVLFLILLAWMAISVPAVSQPANQDGFAWPPRKGDVIGNLSFVDFQGLEFVLGRLQGDSILLELAAGNSPVSQALAGGNLVDSLGPTLSDPNVLALFEHFPYDTNGLEFDSGQFDHVVVLTRDLAGDAPTSGLVRQWGEHFPYPAERRRYLLCATPALLDRGLGKEGPAFYLLDGKREVLAAAHGENMMSNLREEVLPELGRMNGFDGAEDDSGALSFGMEDIEGMEPLPGSDDPVPAGPGRASARAGATDSANLPDYNAILPELTESNYERRLERVRGMAMIFFFSPADEASVQAGPVVLKVADRHRRDVQGFRADVSEQAALIERFSIDTLPTVVILDEGREIARGRGVLSEAELEDTLAQLIARQ